MIVRLHSSRRILSSSKGEVFQGEFCEENVRISDALFPGQHSWMSVDLVTAVRSDKIPGVFYFDIVKIELYSIYTTRFNTHITLELKPAQAEGLILYMAGAQYTGDYLSLLLVNGSLIFTYSLGSGDRSSLVQ